VYEKPVAPASIGGVLDDGLRLWRISLGKTWGLALLAQAVNSMPAILFPTAPVAAAANLSLNERLMMTLGQSSRYSIAFLAFLLISYIFRNAVLLRINGVANNSESTLGQSLSTGLRLTPRTWGMFFLIGLAVVLIGVVLGVVVAVAAAPGASTGARMVLAVAGLVAFCCIFYVSLKFVVAYPALIVDNLSATGSISASWNLTKGYWWRTASILTVLGVIFLVLAVVLVIVGALVGGILGTITPGGLLFLQLAGVALYSVLGSLSPAVVLALYNDLKLRKEGGDLAGRVSALASR
jgi:hypothetical protein